MLSFIIIVVVIDGEDSYKEAYVYRSVDAAISDKYPDSKISKIESNQYYLIFVDDGEANNFPIDIVHVMGDRIEFFSSRVFKKSSLTKSIRLVDYGIASSVVCYFDSDNYVMYVYPTPQGELKVYDADGQWGDITPEPNRKYWFKVVPKDSTDYMVYIELDEKKIELNLSELIGK